MEKEAKKICQSCGMPLKENSDHGTEEDGGRSEEYCRHCYQAGRFTDPDVSMKDLINSQVERSIARFGLDETKAKELAWSTIPKLKRWQEGQNPNKKLLMVLLVFGLAFFIAGLGVFFISSSETGGSEGQDSGFNIAVFLPIWVAVFVPLFAAKQKRLKDNPELARKKITALMVILALTLLVGFLAFIMVD